MAVRFIKLRPGRTHLRIVRVTEDSVGLIARPPISSRRLGSVTSTQFGRTLNHRQLEIGTLKRLQQGTRDLDSDAGDTLEMLAGDVANNDVPAMPNR